MAGVVVALAAAAAVAEIRNNSWCENYTVFFLLEPAGSSPRVQFLANISTLITVRIWKSKVDIELPIRPVILVLPTIMDPTKTPCSLV